MKKQRGLRRACALLLAAALGIGTTGGVVEQEVYASTQMIMNETFENQIPGAVPEGFEVTGDGGAVAVAEALGQKCLNIKNEFDGKYVMATKTFDSILTGAIHFRFSFMQRPGKSDGNVLFAAYDANGNESFVIVTQNGNVCYRVNGQTEVILQDYLAEKWYAVAIDANVNAGTAVVSVDGQNVLKNAVFSCDGGCVKIGAYTQYSPGFYLDDINVTEEMVLNKVVIEGTDIITIPTVGTNEYVFSAYITDPNGYKLSGTPLVWSIENEFTEAAITPQDADATSVIVSIGANATYLGIIRLKVASAEDPSVVAYQTVAIEKQAVSNAKIKGPARITHSLKTSERTYTIYAEDPYGVAINQPVGRFSLNEDAPAWVAIDEKTGVLSMGQPTAEDVRITIYAKVEGIDEIASKAVVLQSKKNYDADQWRMDVLQSSADKVLEWGADPYSGTPLLASGIDLRTMLPIEWQQSVGGRKAAYSNLAADTTLYQVFDDLSRLLDEPKYNEKVNEIYQWYMDHGLADNMLGYWGGHTFMDLKTLTPFHTTTNPVTHEFKTTNFYLEPFFRLDSAKAYEIGKNIWLGHIYNWETLLMNRHAFYTTAHDASNWENLDAFADDYAPLDSKAEEPFRNCACDLIMIGAQMYKMTGDPNAKEWTMRMIRKYHELAPENTNIIPILFASAKDCDVYTLPEDWYTYTTFKNGETTVMYGDRFFNQFADDLVDQGYYDKSCLEKGNYTITEIYYLDNHKADFILSDLYTADLLGKDTEEGQYIVEHLVKHVAGYIKYAWKENTNQLKHIMIDGTDLSHFVPKKNGYYGNYYKLNREMGTYGASAIFTYAAMQIYSEAVRYGYQEEADIIWNYIKYAAENIHDIGIIGEAYAGDEGVRLNYGTECSEPYILCGVVDLYHATGNQKFLDLARLIARNVITSFYKYGILCHTPGVGTSQGSYYNLMFGGNHAKVYYGLAYIEAAIRGDESLAPRQLIYGGYYGDTWVNEDNSVSSTSTLDTSIFFYESNPRVKVTDILIDTTVTLKAGETVDLAYSTKPSDAANSSVSFWITDMGVAKYNSTTQKLTGLSAGTTEMICVSSDLNATKTVKIIVEGEEES